MLDLSNNRLKDEYIYSPGCNYNGTMPNLRSFNISNNELTRLNELSALTRFFDQLNTLDVSNNKLSSTAYGQELQRRNRAQSEDTQPLVPDGVFNEDVLEEPGNAAQGRMEEEVMSKLNAGEWRKMKTPEFKAFYRAPDADESEMLFVKNEKNPKERYKNPKENNFRPLNEDASDFIIGNLRIKLTTLDTLHPSKSTMLWTLFSLCVLFSGAQSSDALTSTTSPGSLALSPCSIYDYGRYADCSGRHLNTVPCGAKSVITDLKLDHLDFWKSNPGMLMFERNYMWLSKVKELSIQYVIIVATPCAALKNLRALQVLDVSHNRLREDYIYNWECNYNGTMPNLRSYNLSNNELTRLNDLSAATRYFGQLNTLDVSNNKLGSTAYGSRCIWNKNLTRFIAHHNDFVSAALHCLPTTVEYLDLSYCNLDQLDTTFFEKTSYLKELLLSGNKIKYIPSGWKSPSLQSLKLDGNSFGAITVNSFQKMSLLSSLKAGNNPYQCTCDLHAFFEETFLNHKVNLTDWPWNYHCYHPLPLLNKQISNYNPGRVTCDTKLLILICAATTAAVIIVLMVICYIFDLPWYTKATYQIIRAKYRAHQEKEGVELFTYHAFISYSHWDADWVRDQLLPALEDIRNPYRLCIHERDFTPGKWIIDNIIENIENSRKIIFVLSRHFVNSEWCNYELYFAQQRAMGKSFSDVILVVKEPIDPGSLPNKYCKLRKMLRTKTYLEWPQQGNQQSFFWAQLRSVLGNPSPVRPRSYSGRNRAQSEDTQLLDPDGVFNEDVVEEPGNAVQGRMEEQVMVHKGFSD
ncbi:hypothetical protein WMY93_031497 [Mugilogobius chulae]|uniref:TIR domain-containing protein n=1 Tax=Mugilogobius chulae TaxID=88201 RepID=A0AAW0MFX6_9GOBI